MEQLWANGMIYLRDSHINHAGEFQESFDIETLKDLSLLWISMPQLPQITGYLPLKYEILMMRCGVVVMSTAQRQSNKVEFRSCSQCVGDS